MKRCISLLLLGLAGTAHALINPNFTPVQLIRQATAIWTAEISHPEGNEDIFVATALQNLKGEALQARADIHFGSDPMQREDILREIKEGSNAAYFITGDFSGASMDGGDVEEQPWAMVKIGIQWHMISRDEEGVLHLRRDEIDLSTVWAGDVRNLVEVTTYILENPRATVPVASGARWGAEQQVAELEGTIHGIAAFTIAENPLVIVYREEGDVILSPAQEFADISGYLGLQSASRHATWGRFTDSPAVSMASAGADGTLQLWHREGEEFVLAKTWGPVADITGLATVARPGRAALLVGTAAGMQVHLTAEDTPAEVLPAAPEALGAAGRVLALDLNGDGHADFVQSHAQGIHLIRGADRSAHTFSHPQIGTPMSVAAADFTGDGRLDLLISGDRHAVFMVQEPEGTFTERLRTTGELSYNIRPGVNFIAVGDHALDGRQDLVLFNHQLPPQIYFNRGFAVFGYDMELDLQEDAFDTLDALGSGQQAGLLADLNGDGLQELLAISREGAVWHVTRDTEGVQVLGARLFPPAGVSGPIPLVIRDGQDIIGARIASPEAPAHIGRRNRGPVTVEFRLPGESESRTERVIILRAQQQTLAGE